MQEEAEGDGDDKINGDSSLQKRMNHKSLVVTTANKIVVRQMH
jgi:hypothetical protein